jgi:ABC-type transporter Mla subunit MlaD
MSAKTNDFKIGTFVLAGVALLLLGLFAFGARSYFEKTIEFETYITGHVDGLSEGSPVKLRGVPVGKVTSIGFAWHEYPQAADNFVVVRFDIRASVSPLEFNTAARQRLSEEIDRGLRARVQGQGITGTSIISLDHVDPTKNPPMKITWKPRDFYIPSAPSVFGQMLASIEKSLHNLEELDLSALGQSAQQALHSVDKVVQKLDGLDLQGLSTNVNGLVSDLRGTSAKLQTLVDDAGGTIKGMHLPNVAKNADQLITGVERTNLKLQSLLDNLIGLELAPLTDTLLNARDATANLNDALRELKDYPSGFIFGRPPPPAKSVERPRN